MTSQQISENTRFNIENCIYQNSLPKYLIAKTKLGDRVLIRINANNNEFKPSENDAFIEKRDSITLVKEETKMGVLQCLDHGIFGCAFICENGLSLCYRKNQNEYTEENFIFTTIPPSFTNKSGVYPIVHFPIEKEDEKKIASAAENIAKISFIRLRSYNKSLEDAIIVLMEQNRNLARVSFEVERDLNEEIRRLTEIYEGLPLSDLSVTIQNALINRKELRTQFLNSLFKGYKITGMCHLISEELRKETDGIITTYYNSINKY